MTTPSLAATRWNSTLATDPLRTFRFHAVFTPALEGDVFDSRIKTDSSGKLPANGTSTGWVGGFTRIDGLSITTQSIAYREGGYNTTVHQVPGMTTFDPITMSRGVLYGNDQAITWMRGLFAAAAGNGLGVTTGKGFRVNVDIYVQDHPHAQGPASDKNKLKFRIHNAWITSLRYSNLDATDGSILFETMTLTHEGLSVSFVTD